MIIAGHRGEATAVHAGLSDADADVRASALTALQRLGGMDASAFSTAAADAHPLVRRRAATVAGTWFDGPLDALLQDEDDGVVEVACWAAGERPLETETFPQLMEIATGHEDPLCRESAVAALGALGDDRGLPAILHGCTDKPAVRRRAVLALAPFDGPEVQAALTKALEDRDWQVRQAAEDLL